MSKIRTWLKTNWLFLLFLLAIFFASSYFLLFAPMFYTHDYLHGARIVEMATGLKEGQFPVIWSGNFGFGYGMPLFEFYAPLPYFLGALVYLAGLPLVLAVKVIFLATNIITILGAYLLGRKFFGKSGGVLVAAAITLAPYRAVDLFVRGALSEAMAIAFLPWIFLGAAKVILDDQKKIGGAVLTFSLVGLVLSHNLTALLTVPILALWIILLLIYKHGKKFLIDWSSWRVLFGSGLLAVGLSCFYWLPALLEKNLTQADTYLLGDYFNYYLHFAYWRQFFTPTFDWYGGSGWGTNDGMSFFLGAAQLLFSLVAGVLAVIFLIKKITTKKLNLVRNQRLLLLIGAAFLLFFSLLMSTYKAAGIWQIFDFLKYVQFPWRYLAISLVWIGFLNGAVIWLTKNKKVQIIFMSIGVLLMIMTNVWFFRGDPEGRYQNTAEIFYTLDTNKIRHNLSGVLVDYLPKDFSSDWTAISTDLILLSPPQASGSSEILVDRMHEKLAQTHFSEPTLVGWGISFYPGWQAEIDGEKTEIILSETGNIMVNVPSGDHLVGVKLQPTPIRLATLLISIASVFILMYSLIIEKKSNKSHAYRQAGL